MFANPGMARRFASIVQIRICGSHPAWYVQTRPPTGGAYSDAVETAWGSQRVLALYSYPKTATPDPSAEASLRTLCPHAN